MSSKELYQEQKKSKLARKNKLKALRIMKADLNRQLSNLKFNKDISEDVYVNLLSELNAVEVNLFKLLRNKLNSNFYEFTPSKLKLG